MSNEGLEHLSLAGVADLNWERPFLLDGRDGETWSYGRVLSAAEALRQRLCESGVVEGDRVMLGLPNGIPCIAGYFACLLGGYVAVPLHGQLATADRDFIVETTRPRAVLSDLADDGNPGLCYVSPVFETDGVSREAVLHRLREVDLGRLFTVHFTSGTTGRPKGVCHSVGSLLRSAAAFNELLGFQPRHRFLHILPMAYMAGFLNTILCPFLAGASVVVGEAYHARMPLDFWSLPRGREVNVLWIVPSMAAALLAVDKDALGAEYCRSSIEIACVGTAPLPAETARKFQEKYGVRLLESYGLSETLFVASNSVDLPGKIGSVGRLLSGVRVEIRDDEGLALPVGSAGDIWIRSNATTVGYFGVAPLENDGRGFPSGDIGRLDDEGYLFITGRKKDLIIRGGINVSPRAIEEVILRRDDLVAAVAVIGVPNVLKGEEIVVFVQPASHQDFETAKLAILEFCRENLAPHQRPDRILGVEQMPLGISGKIQKHILRAGIHPPAAPVG